MCFDGTHIDSFAVLSPLPGMTRKKVQQRTLNGAIVVSTPDVRTGKMFIVNK
jgi:hypothetical protein